MKRFVFVLMLLGGLAMAEQALPGGTAHDWYERMVQASRQQNYEGVLLYGNQRHWDSLAIQHLIVNNEEFEHLQQLSGVPLEQLRHGNKIASMVAAGKQPQRLQNPLHSFLPGHDLRQQYDLTLGDIDRIAGHYARQIILQPKDNYRYGMRLWLEQNSALLLRSDLLDERQRVLERIQFAQVTIGQPADTDAFSADLPWQSLPAPQGYEQALVSWRPFWLPDGFTLLAAAEHDDTIRLLYADGLAAFSVFIDAQTDLFSSLDRRWGATSAVVRLVQNDQAGARRVTAVGELPAATLEKIIQSVRPAQAATERPVTEDAEQEQP